MNYETNQGSRSLQGLLYKAVQAACLLFIWRQNQKVSGRYRWRCMELTPYSPSERQRHGTSAPETAAGLNNLHRKCEIMRSNQCCMERTWSKSSVAVKRGRVKT